MNFDHEELMLMMLYNTGTRLGLIQDVYKRQELWTQIKAILGFDI